MLQPDVKDRALHGSDARPVRLGIVGCGGISHRHAPAAAVSAEVAIVACCDTRTDVAEDWAATYGCEHVYGDYRAMVDELEIDGVLLATWPVQHCEQILGCLEAGVRFILCEKALTTSGAEALEVFRAAEAAAATVIEELMYRHHPAVQQVGQLRVAGALPQRGLAGGAGSERYGRISRFYGLIGYDGPPVGMGTSSTRSDFDHEL